MAPQGQPASFLREMDYHPHDKPRAPGKRKTAISWAGDSSCYSFAVAMCVIRLVALADVPVVQGIDVPLSVAGQRFGVDASIEAAVAEVDVRMRSQDRAPEAEALGGDLRGVHEVVEHPVLIDAATERVSE